MKKRLLRTLPVLAAVIALLLSAAAVSIYGRICMTERQTDNEPESNTASDTSGEVPSLPSVTGAADTEDDTEKKEMRGIWIPYMSLQLSADERTPEGFESKMRTVFDRCVSCGLNTVIVQVRPFADALYDSRYFPYSHILTGTQGVSPGFDPLEIMADLAHERGLDIHAWINPLRIKLNEIPYNLSADNPYVTWKNSGRKNDPFFFTCDGGLYFDPSDKDVRRLIIDGVRELAENYDIDGVQIDDYFYPSDDESIDAESYELYRSTVTDGEPMTHSQWRMNNINMLVCGIYTALHSAKNDIVFGISPQCNFDNNEKMSADVYSWCTYSGYADYICPQIYVSNEHPVFPFRELADKWLSFMKNESASLYFGLALYKVGTDADNGTWLTDEDVIASQTEYLRSIGADGFILYSYEYLDNYKCVS